MKILVTVMAEFLLLSEFGVHLAELTLDREGALAVRQVRTRIFFTVYNTLFRSSVRELRHGQYFLEMIWQFLTE